MQNQLFSKCFEAFLCKHTHVHVVFERFTIVDKKNQNFSISGSFVRNTAVMSRGPTRDMVQRDKRDRPGHRRILSQKAYRAGKQPGNVGSLWSRKGRGKIKEVRVKSAAPPGHTPLAEGGKKEELFSVISLLENCHNSCMSYFRESVQLQSWGASFGTWMLPSITRINKATCSKDQSKDNQKWHWT